MTTIEQDNIVVWNKDGINTYAWVDGGRRSWPIDSVEKQMKPEAFFDLIRMTWQNGKFYRCTGCGTLIRKEDVAGWPLFAGVACVTCNEKHLAHLQDQRDKGNVCRKCGEPFGNCCC